MLAVIKRMWKQESGQDPLNTRFWWQWLFLSFSQQFSPSANRLRIACIPPQTLWHPVPEPRAVGVGKAAAQGRADRLAAVKADPRALALGAVQLEVEELSVAAAALAGVAAGGVYRITRFLPRSKLQFFR